ncbi:unnamed protein product [Symbiodinium natans]|uniref:Uncharacterized protein n=1 Tax=Symbiodinium natans TaxID=878477 RepID=A0A812SM97_9DINO|nr:unnamed protein product [Symbiodinium natans]
MASGYSIKSMRSALSRWTRAKAKVRVAGSLWRELRERSGLLQAVWKLNLLKVQSWLNCDPPSRTTPGQTQDLEGGDCGGGEVAHERGGEVDTEPPTSMATVGFGMTWPEGAWEPAACEACEACEALPAYADGDRVEYFSPTYGLWLLAEVMLQSEASKRKVSYSVTLKGRSVPWKLPDVVTSFAAMLRSWHGRRSRSQEWLAAEIDGLEIAVAGHKSWLRSCVPGTSCPFFGHVPDGSLMLGQGEGGLCEEMSRDEESAALTVDRKVGEARLVTRQHSVEPVFFTTIRNLAQCFLYIKTVQYHHEQHEAGPSWLWLLLVGLATLFGLVCPFIMAAKISLASFSSKVRIFGQEALAIAQAQQKFAEVRGSAVEVFRGPTRGWIPTTVSDKAERDATETASAQSFPFTQRRPEMTEETKAEPPQKAAALCKAAPPKEAPPKEAATRRAAEEGRWVQAAQELGAEQRLIVNAQGLAEVALRSSQAPRKNNYNWEEFAVSEDETEEAGLRWDISLGEGAAFMKILRASKRGLKNWYEADEAAPAHPKSSKSERRDLSSAGVVGRELQLRGAMEAPLEALELVKSSAGLSGGRCGDVMEPSEATRASSVPPSLVLTRSCLEECLECLAGQAEPAEQEMPEPRALVSCGSTGGSEPREPEPRNPFAEWRDSGYALPGTPESIRKASTGWQSGLLSPGDDWMFGVREALGGKVAKAEQQQVELSERLTGAEADPAILRFSQHFHERMQAREGQLRDRLLEEQAGEEVEEAIGGGSLKHKKIGEVVAAPLAARRYSYECPQCKATAESTTRDRRINNPGEVVAAPLAARSYSYGCPQCKATVESTTRDGRINNPRKCGHQFTVAAGEVVAAPLAARHYSYECPQCKATVESTARDGRINNRRKCGHQFTVAAGEVVGERVMRAVRAGVWVGGGGGAESMLSATMCLREGAGEEDEAERKKAGGERLEFREGWGRIGGGSLKRKKDGSGTEWGYRKERKWEGGGTEWGYRDGGWVSGEGQGEGLVVGGCWRRWSGMVGKGKGGGEGGQGKGLVAQWVLLYSGKWLEKKWQGRRVFTDAAPLLLASADKERARIAQETYEELAERVEQAQIARGLGRTARREERDLALGGKDSREELEKQIEEMREGQRKLELELAESRAREAERAGELKEKEAELITVRREKVVLTKELADAKKREKELAAQRAELLEQAQQHILELTSVRPAAAVCNFCTQPQWFVVAFIFANRRFCSAGFGEGSPSLEFELKDEAGEILADLDFEARSGSPLD